MVRQGVLWLALACACGSWGAALSVPLNGWGSTDPKGQDWVDPQGACRIREDRSAVNFPRFDNQKDALSFAQKLQVSLAKGGVSDIVTQPVERAGDWAVLAAYTYQEQGTRYHVTQLYLSELGKLKTISGSSAQHEASACVNEMREFIRYLAN